MFQLNAEGADIHRKMFFVMFKEKLLTNITAYWTLPQQ